MERVADLHKTAVEHFLQKKVSTGFQLSASQVMGFFLHLRCIHSKTSKASELDFWIVERLFWILEAFLFRRYCLHYLTVNPLLIAMQIVLPH